MKDEADISHGFVEDGHADRAGAGAAGSCQNRDDANLLYGYKRAGTGIASALYGSMMLAHYMVFF